MSVSQAEWMDLSAAAQIIAPGSIVLEEYQKEITDALRRNSILDGRLNYTPATGDFSSYFEQTEIKEGGFVDPRNPTSTPVSNARVPRSAKVKAITNQTNFGHYDITLGHQQGNFTELQAKDVNDMINGIGLAHGKGLWRGNDTELANPTTVQYVGIQKQITNTFNIDKDGSIIAGIRAKVAAMVGSEKFELRPTAIYIDPIGHYYLEEEVRVAEENNVKISGMSKTVVAGIEVVSIMTAAGYLPIIPEPFITSSVNATDNTMTDYGIVIVTEPWLEYHYVGKKDAYIFQLGTTSDLQQKFVGIKYGCPIAKGASYAHASGKITRPTIVKVG
ncbi:hypothetical protein P4H66_19475 [Paenibacillus dokdonensis]|uniref:Phage capsid protein n=1 Tax=Paenibacillus dokdonensis TaxID=2567944 RepID=A0ABU6GUZ9_9BACL|nr:hypothetical protein [Paenibacillus dokdonensis]MEC0241987.1 hypothetical protein [Paenibacillus dokdonensis]